LGIPRWPHSSNPHHVNVLGGNVSQPSGPSDGLTEADQIDIADSIRVAGASDKAFVSLRFGGGRTFVVQRTGSTTAADKSRYLAVLPSGVQGTFERALLSSDQVTAISKIVAERTDWLRSHGVRLQSYGAGTPGPYILGYTQPEAPDDYQRPAGVARLTSGGRESRTNGDYPVGRSVRIAR
jgi:hypothetical protein